VPLDYNEIRQLLATIAQTDISEVTLKSDDFELTVRKTVTVPHQILPAASSGLGVVEGAGMTQMTPPAPLQGISPPSETVLSRGVATNPVSGGGQPPASTPSVIESKVVEIPSPMVGTFYRSPAPGEAAFVEVGDRVRNGQTVCIIEAMKLMNEIETEVSGQIMEILVQNGEPVEYGQPLMRIKPD
jgi:acetyl-CoA carboxylase biotin carboxyl carrier protein